jgi:hypothetical protein
MTSCAQFDKLLDRDLARHAQPHQLSNGTCPFCGRVLSRELWNLEKKK